MKKLVLIVILNSLIGTNIIADEKVLSGNEVALGVVKDSGFYMGLAYSSTYYKSDYVGNESAVIDNTYFDNYSGKINLNYDAFMLQTGYKFNDYFSIEGRYWKSIGKTKLHDKGNGNASGTGTYTYNTSINNKDEFSAWGIYLKPTYPINKTINIYALLGYGKINLEYNNEKWFDSYDYHMGVGATYQLSNKLTLFIDYVHFYNNDFLDNGSYPVVGDTIIWNEEEDQTMYTINIGLSYSF